MSNLGGFRVGCPQDEAKLFDVVAVVTSMEADNLHAFGHLDADPACGAAPTPLSLLNLAAIRVNEADAVDVALSIANIHLNGPDHLHDGNLVHLRVKRATCLRVESLALNVTAEGELELVKVRVSLVTEAIQLDWLVTRKLSYVSRICRPLEAILRVVSRSSNGLGLSDTWRPTSACFVEDARVDSKRFFFHKAKGSVPFLASHLASWLTITVFTIKVCTPILGLFDCHEVGVHEGHALQLYHLFFELFLLHVVSL